MFLGHVIHHLMWLTYDQESKDKHGRHCHNERGDDETEAPGRVGVGVRGVGPEGGDNGAHYVTNRGVGIPDPHQETSSAHTERNDAQYKTVQPPQYNAHKRQEKIKRYKELIPLFSKPVTHNGNHTGPACGLKKCFEYQRVVFSAIPEIMNKFGNH